MRDRRLLAASLVLCAVAAAGAQLDLNLSRTQSWFPTAESFGHGFNFCRGMYSSVRGEPGGQGWSTDYPNAEVNFSIRLSELTKTRVSLDATGSPQHLIVRLTDDALFQCPFVLMSDVGTLAFTIPEVARLRSYLLKGGFLWVDDFWGTVAWERWVVELARVLPAHEHPIHDVPIEHSIFRTVFAVKEVPQIPSIQFWRRSRGGTSERGSDSATAHMRGVSDRNGNLLVLMTHNTDIADSWEREGEDTHYFYSFSPAGYALGINVLVYTLTH